MFPIESILDRSISHYQWISTEWVNPFKNPVDQNSGGKALIADAHRAQQTDSVKEILKKDKTSLVNVPPGFTPGIQVVNVLINKPFKDEVRSLFEDPLDKNLDQYLDGKINASQQGDLMKKWVGEAWPKVAR